MIIVVPMSFKFINLTTSRLYDFDSLFASSFYNIFIIIIQSNFLFLIIIATFYSNAKSFQDPFKCIQCNLLCIYIYIYQST